MPTTTPLTQAIALVEEFAADWLDEYQPVRDVAVRWGLAPGTVRSLAIRLNLPARRRGPKKQRVAGTPLDSPRELVNGRWVGRRGIVHWVPGK